MNRFLEGKKVYLRPIQRSDMSCIQGWINNFQIRRLIGDVRPMSDEALEQYYDKLTTDESRVWFAVVSKENDKVIGEIGLLRMFHFWRTTDLSIIIGDESAQGKGYGSEAIHLILDYAFGYLNFHRVAIGVVGFNEKAIEFYEKIGFKRRYSKRGVLF